MSGAAAPFAPGTGAAAPARGAAAPDWTVIVPVFRDWAQVPALLAALAAQTGPDGTAAAGFELILVDNDPDGPADPAAAAVAAALPALPFAARVLACAAPGSYAARNAGARVAAGRRGLAFTDADCRPEPGWLAALDAALDETPDRILAGSVTIDPGPAPTPWAIFDTVRGIPQQVFVRHGYGATANLALGPALFARIGGFDATRLSGGDAEFCRRAGRMGIRMRHAGAACVRHPARGDLPALATKARRIKGGQVATGPRLRRVLWTLRSLAPPLREMLAYLRSPHPWRWRAVACRVRLRLWGVELAELWRLLVQRHPPERR